MNMILLYFVICGLQGMVTAALLAFAKRNEVQEQRETRHNKLERRLGSSQRKHIRRQIRSSNRSKQDSVFVYHPGSNCPAQ